MKNRPSQNVREPQIETVSLGELTWTNISAPTKKETDYLAEKFGFDQYALDDCLSRKQLPKVDRYDGYLFIIVHFPVFRHDIQVSVPSQVSIFIGKNYLVTLHNGELKPIANLFRQCGSQDKSRQDAFSRGSGYLLYRLLDRLIDYYFPILDKILGHIDDIEDKVFDRDVEVTEELAVLRRDIITQRRILRPMPGVLNQLQNDLKPYAPDGLEVEFGDLRDHADKIWSTLDECQEVIEVYKDSDYVLVTSRLNTVIRVLTILSTVLLPFLIVSSIYGMNIFLPGGIEKGNLTQFVILILIMMFISGGMLLFFHRKKWI